MSKKVILVTGASSGFGRLSAEALARAGHTVYASMRDTKGRNAPDLKAICQLAIQQKDSRPEEKSEQKVKKK
jgi:NAD(P)-dependent dehydrogenase (short-subunit alcohol dehydrogenase family)